MEDQIIAKEIPPDKYLPLLQFHSIEHAVSRLQTVNKLPTISLIPGKWPTEASTAEWYPGQEGILSQETYDHIFQCWGVNAEKIFDEALTLNNFLEINWKAETWCHTQNICPTN